MTDSFQVDPDRLAQHATDVERISQDMLVVERVGQTALPEDAYGLIGRPFASSLIQSDQQMRNKLGTYADGLSFHATRLRDTVQAYQDHDRATAGNLNQMYPDDSAGPRAGTRAKGGGSGGSGSGGSRSGGGAGGGRPSGSGPGKAGDPTAGTGTPESIGKALLGDEAGPGSGPGAGHAGARDGHHEEFSKVLGALSDKRLGNLEHDVDHRLDQVEDQQDQLDARRDAIEHQLHGRHLSHDERAGLEHRLRDVDRQRDTLGHRHDELLRDYDEVGDELDTRGARAHGHPVRAEGGRGRIA